MKQILAFFLVFSVLAQPAQAWSERGHHIIAVLAFELLSPQEQARLVQALSEHPDFARISEYGDSDIQIVGRAAYWPDIARSSAKWNRPSWHYQLGATEIRGDVPKVPDFPMSLPLTADLSTQELHIQQAVQLCVGVVQSQEAPAPDKALALSWLLHLIADGHQPCHAGSFYAAYVFPNGDRGANSIPVKQGRNMHALWDGLLGRSYDKRRIEREVEDLLTRASRLESSGLELGGTAEIISGQWLEESRTAARAVVYTEQIRRQIDVASKAKTDVSPIDLPEAYLKEAGEVARIRATIAGVRLARVLSDCLAK